MTTSRTVSASAGTSSQTLSRGIQLLELLAVSDGPLTIAAAAEGLGLHRSVTYRILRTLEDHGLVERDRAGLLALGPGMAALAQGVAKDLQAAALPELTTLANELSMTAFLAVLNRTECITLTTVEPRNSNVTVAQRPGTRHRLDVGATGLAIQSALLPAELESLLPGETVRGEVAEVRNRGYATSRDEVIPGVSAVSAPLLVPGRPPAAISVVYISTNLSVQLIGERLMAAAGNLTGLLR